MQTFTIKLKTRHDGEAQLRQMLDEEVKAGYIKKYEIERKPSIIEDLAELKRMAKGGANFFLTLNGGLRSSKFIDWQPKAKKFYILNEIDGSEQNLKEAELFTESNIGEAIKKRALIFEN